MAEQKKQHYIPRFYFKLFSPNKRSIEVYNLKSKNAYSGSYRKLCAKNYFYSKRGEVETSLFLSNTPQLCCGDEHITDKQLQRSRILGQ
jgi:hypothetical protein